MDDNLLKRANVLKGSIEIIEYTLYNFHEFATDELVKQFLPISEKERIREDIRVRLQEKLKQLKEEYNKL